MEITNTLAMVFWLMDFRRPEGSLGDIAGGKENAKGGRHRVHEFQAQSHITSTHEGPFIEFRPRDV